MKKENFVFKSHEKLFFPSFSPTTELLMLMSIEKKKNCRETQVFADTQKLLTVENT
jgi:hypothetical protein